MATKIIMPKLGFDMSSGKVVRWLHKIGDPLRKGEPVLEIETDKATVEVSAEVDGILGAIFVQEGDVPVGQPIGEIVAQGEKASAGAEAPAQKPPEQKPSEAVEPAKEATRHPEPKAPAAPVTTGAVAGPSTEPRAGSEDGEGRVAASPLARRMARELGIALSQIKGTGPGGRVVKDDVEAFQVSKSSAGPLVKPSAAPVAQPSAPAAVQAGEILLTRMRQTIARRMAESKGPVPQFYLTTEVEMDAAVQIVKKMLEAGKDEDLRVSPMTLVIKACALALNKFPPLNASFGGDRIVLHDHVNIGIAVAVEGGLLTPVIPDCDQKSVAQIARETRGAAERARAGKLNQQDLTQGTFSISNLGMYDIDQFVAIVNPPEAAILAIGTAKEMPVVADGQLKPGWRMRMTLSADHRVTDGAEAARFLRDVKSRLQVPMSLFL